MRSLLQVTGPAQRGLSHTMRFQSTWPGSKGSLPRMPGSNRPPRGSAPSSPTLSHIVDNVEPRHSFRFNDYNQKFAKGEVYDPRNLDERAAEAVRKRRSHLPSKKVHSDIYTRSHSDPLAEYKNVNRLSQYVSFLGRIKPQAETHLTNKNQRLVAKAIRRARSFGLLPITYKLHSDPKMR
ncbi:hypothetical protein IWQ62_001132 [Dispira parvispora]|uniref:Small ribosomal subunit protein bS18m n=1 Tax=Dispira parvispora TaxID=1520584 RepID=A0A9W8AZS4_9FUNG|nr:hypothetical protein IWQ62_001132 [Dispira parvispora]